MSFRVRKAIDDLETYVTRDLWRFIKNTLTLNKVESREDFYHSWVNVWVELPRAFAYAAGHFIAVIIPLVLTFKLVQWIFP